ncbi:MAG: TIGR01777 family oxidoreductase [Verrucomicrobiota bacterium]
MKTEQTILVTGATGLVGRVLCEALEAKGHRVRRLGRGSDSDFQWDLEVMSMSAGAMEGVDTVVHLAGESVAQRWTEAAKERILRSRTRSTQLLAEAILKQDSPPAYIGASGSNFYGYNRGDALDESASSGEGYLAEVCRAWEGAAQPLLDAGVRCVFVRTGVVLSKDGGALAKMLPPFKAGVGGRIGSGRQWMSWISLDDLVAIYVRAVEDAELNGPVNAVAPKAVTNAVFTKALGGVIGRPTVFPLPSFMVKTLFGEMGEETVLADVALVPQRLMDIGFEWAFPNLNDALEACLSR